MLITAKAIVLRTIAHGDRSIVLKAWTSHAGARSYLVRSGKRLGPVRSALQPLSRIELVAEERPDRDLHQVRELRMDEPFMRIPFDPVRGALALFAQELFYRVLRAEGEDQELDRAVRQAVHDIDSTDQLRWLPHRILVDLTGPLGFRPESPEPGEDHFDLQEGRFMPAGARHGHLLAPPLSTALAALLQAPPQAEPDIASTAPMRRELLDHLLLFYRIHLEGMGEMRSPAVLHAVLN